MSSPASAARKALVLQAGLNVLGAWRALDSPTWLAVTFVLAAAAIGLAVVMRPTAPLRFALLGFEAAAVAAGVAAFLAGHYVLGTVMGLYLLLGTLRTPASEFVSYDDSHASGGLDGAWAEPVRDTSAAPWAQPAPPPFPGHPAAGAPTGFTGPVPAPPASPASAYAQPAFPPAGFAPGAPAVAPAGVHDPRLATPAALVPPGPPFVPGVAAGASARPAPWAATAPWAAATSSPTTATARPVPPAPAVAVAPVVAAPAVPAQVKAGPPNPFPSARAAAPTVPPQLPSQVPVHVPGMPAPLQQPLPAAVPPPPAVPSGPEPAPAQQQAQAEQSPVFVAPAETDGAATDVPEAPKAQEPGPEQGFQPQPVACMTILPS